MGSIININTNPQSWYIETTKNPLFTKTTKEELVKAHIGISETDYTGSSEIIIYIRKNIYNKLLSGEYTVKKNQIKFIVEDKNKKTIKPFYEDGQTIY